MGWRARLLSGLDSPVGVSALVVTAAIAFVLLRLDLVAQGDITRFIDVGSDFVNRHGLPHGLTVVPGGGYDGQFYYRLALDPANLHRHAFGITIDNAFRVQRITYSALAWVAAAGQPSLVPYTLVATNVAGLGVMAYLSALLARDSGRRPLWGLLIVGYFGFLFSLGRDLTEICEACFVVSALLALRRGHPVLAGFLLTAAVLSRETALVVAGGIAVVSLIDIARKRRRPGLRDVAWVLPVIAFAAWQLVGRAAFGTLPIRADAGDNLSFPSVAMAEAIGHYLRTLPSEHALIWLAEFGALLTVVVLAAGSLRPSMARPAEKVAWVFSVSVVLCLSGTIWSGHADFRGFEDVYVLSTIVLLGSDRRLRGVAVVVAGLWALTFVHRVLLF